METVFLISEVKQRVGVFKTIITYVDEVILQLSGIISQFFQQLLRTDRGVTLKDLSGQKMYD